MMSNMSDTEFMLLLQKRFPQEDCSGPVRTGATQCEGSYLHLWLLGYGFIIVFCLAVIGNCLNLLIYNSDHIRFYLAIRMLCTRLLMNTLTMLCLLPNALRLLQLWPPQSTFDSLFWKLWPYTSFFGNLFGFFAMWLTVLMIAECWFHIFVPARSKSVCTHVNLRRCYAVILSTGTALTIIIPINRTPSFGKDSCSRMVVNVVPTYNTWYMSLVELGSTVGTTLLGLLLPLCLLVIMTCAIFCKLTIGARGETKTHFSSEKRSVTRLTLITTALQLADFPSVFVFIIAAWKGPSGVSEVCTLHTVSLFLGLCNMSMSFYIYLLFSPRFRGMVTARFNDIAHALLPCIYTQKREVRKGRRTTRTSGDAKTVYTSVPHPSQYRMESLSQGITEDDENFPNKSNDAFL